MLDEFLKVHIEEEKKSFWTWFSINVAMVVLLVLSMTGVI